jgi:hypothetical protein
MGAWLAPASQVTWPLGTQQMTPTRWLSCVHRQDKWAKKGLLSEFYIFLVWLVSFQVPYSLTSMFDIQLIVLSQSSFIISFLR